MDDALIDWLNAAADPELDPHQLYRHGVDILRNGASAPKVVIADAHCRLAALAFLSGDHPTALGHGIHAAQLGLDLSVEAQLHVLPRALGLLTHAAARVGGESTLAGPVHRQASSALAAAMERSTAAADTQLTRLACLQTIAQGLVEVAPDDRDAAIAGVGVAAASLALQFEAAGELALGSIAATLVPE